ncbi:hypothetical protein PVAND_011025 [Polypedilum vanderplanki]|uniref:Centrosomal protein n=1 Tax=Polypedilum vanderplanki TaxID=319348 RepID=A0A9J6CHD8_POLVA|nr:hypothetical protein PVAND_011025 [Polypedilum vanderplanki]
MDWKQILSISNENLTDELKEEVYHEFIKDQKFDSKIVKKLFPLCLNILKFKGQQVEKQRDELQMLASSDIDLEQIDKQKKMLNKYEAERIQFKAKIKELSDEIAVMHGRELQGSGEDSPDQLSEINNQQELLSKISAKNKHIKRLLREIEKNEEETASYLNVIKNMKMTVEQANEKIAQLETQLSESNAANSFFEDKVEKLSQQLLEQEQENKKFRDELEEREKEVQHFSIQVEERCMRYKQILNEKQNEINILKERYERLVEQVPGMDVDGIEIENKRLIDSSREKDELIRVYEEKFQLLSHELMDSTETIRKLIDMKEELEARLSRNRLDDCCKETRAMLEKSNQRNIELQEMLEKADEDNILKSKQAFEAIETLRSYENTTDGLAEALKKIHQLQETVHQRDKQIRELVVEVNMQNEVSAENSILRKRLGLPDDEIIETKAFMAKQKRFAKINERLMLKLRASEEMRLQLKIDKHELKRKIMTLEKRLNGEVVEDDDELNQSYAASECSETSKIKSAARKEKNLIEMKQCRNCSVAFNVYERTHKYCRNCIMSQNLCENCTINYKETSTENIALIKKIAKLEIDHQSVVEENENLRTGLGEILEKLQSYNGSSSEKSIVNPATLEKLLYILKLSSSMKSLAQETSQTVVETNETATALEIQQKDVEVVEDETLQLKLLIEKLSNENDEMKLNLEKMTRLQEQYEELVKSSELSDDDKHQLLVKSLERCHEFESNLQTYERKIDFLMNENDNLHREMKMLKVSSLELVNEMKMEILNKTEEMVTIDMDENEENENDISTVEEELQRLRLELNGFCFNVLKNIKTLDSENILENLNMEQLSNVTIIENNLTTTFITRRELDSLKLTLAKLKETIKAHETREKHLEELTKIAQHQLKSQQLMLSKFSEDEIVTRHLLVDLQSQSDDNYLLTKTTRELAMAKENEDHTRLENDKLKSEIIVLEEKLLHARNALDEKRRECVERESGNLLKIQYLKKSLVDLRNNYSTLTPIYLIADFIKHYSALLDAKKEFELTKISSKSMPEISHDSLIAQLREMSMTDIEAKIEIIKHKSSCDYLKQQLELHEATISELHNEIGRIKINEIKSNQHWNAIKLLFDETKDNQDNVDSVFVTNEKLKFDKATQVEVMRNDCGTNTEIKQMPQQQQQPIIQNISQIVPAEISVEVNQAPLRTVSMPVLLSPDGGETSLDQQLKKALSLAYSRSSLLIETENQLSELQGRIRVLEKSLENQRASGSDQKQPDETIKGEDHVMITITTLQNVMIEKDATISRYQEILKSERQEHMRLFDENNEQIKQLKKVIDSHEMTIDECNKSIEKLKSSVSELNEKLEAAEAELVEAKQVIPVVTNNDTTERDDMEMKLKETHTEIKKMEQQIKDLTNTERLMQNILNEREVTIKELNIKLKAANDNLETLSENITSASPEIDGLREMLEEKDKHIQDLTETLKQFHDDQQKYITDSAYTSAEQATMMSANLARSETKIRVLETQVEAMKRQMLNLQQREKSSRDLIKTLKNQLIRRPVISVKSDKRPASHREEQQQKRIAELENELLESKDELRRQININDNKKAKNAAELGLWDKQKRYQEMSEKLKAKLTEREIDIERLKANLQMAKNTVKRLENENKMLDNKIKSGQYLQKLSPCQFCKQNAITKQTDSSSNVSAFTDFSDDRAHELVATLKNRVESLTRRNVALELENKSPSQISAEFEKLCEKLSKTEAKVIRLESTNAQLQIEIDLANQRNRDKSQEDKLKHLEDYIIVLKEELAQARVATSIISMRGNEDPESKKIKEMEQTILQLKNIVDKQRVEIKHLKNPKSRTSTSSSSSSVSPTLAYMSSSDRKKEEVFEKLRTEYEKLQSRFNELYTEHSKLQMELDISKSQEIGDSCPHCNQKNMNEMATQDIDVVRQKLQQRDIALIKAKSLITRYQTRERQFKEIISNLKKKICYLEGVPVISEENSECGIENMSNLS